MRSNYKKLGKYVKQVSSRNKDLILSDPKGINIDKEFMPSVANTKGTDLSKYRVVSKNQFAYNPMHVGRDRVLPIGLLQSDSSVIVSPAYTVFEILDENELNPEYLMMWCRRSEFDRNAWFTTDSSVRGGFSWNDMCEMELPVPDIKVQREIVAEYNAVVDRIKLNEKMCEKLEETAQAVYREWFVEFEFPCCLNHDLKDDRINMIKNENEEKNQENPEIKKIKMQTYKSSGGKMVWCEDLEKEVPKGWEAGELGDVIDIFDSQRIPLSGDERLNMEKIYPYYGAAALMDYVDNYIFDGDYILLGEDGTVATKKGTPVLQYVYGKFWVNNHAHVLKGKNGFNEDSLFLLLKNTNITDVITGGVQAKISQTNLKSIQILLPNKEVLENFNKKIRNIFSHIKNLEKQNQSFQKLKNLLLSKMANV